MGKYKFGLAEWDGFVASCPYYDGASPVNNGYGCNHPDQAEQTIFAGDGKTYGECHCFSCPCGTNACSDDIKEAEELGIYLDDNNPEPDEVDGNYLIVPVPEEAKAWVRYQKYMNRYDRNWKQEDALDPFAMSVHKPTDQDVANMMFYLGYEVAAGTTAAARNLRKKTGDEVLALAREYAKAAKAQNEGEMSLADFVTNRINHDKRLNPARVVTCECEKCGDVFGVLYMADGSYAYANEPCECEANFHPIDGEPSISEWLESLF